MTPGGTLAARILDAAGKPVVARVFIKGPWFLYTDSRGDGRLRLEHLPPGAVLVGLAGIGLALREAPVVVARAVHEEDLHGPVLARPADDPTGGPHLAASLRRRVGLRHFGKWRRW